MSLRIFYHLCLPMYIFPYSNTRQPIAGVSFSVNKMNGERVGEFVTDRVGTIFVPGLDSGWYTVTETKAATGYMEGGIFTPSGYLVPMKKQRRKLRDE